MNIDLPNHAADKVKRALDDVHQLTDDPGEMLRIAIMGAGICIGQAGGFLAGLMERQGMVVPEVDAKLQVLELIRITVTDGAESAWASLQASNLGTQAKGLQHGR